MRLSEERYISLLTDFGFKQELREYEDSLLRRIICVES